MTDAPMPRVSEDFQDRVQAKIDAVATGKFFQQKNARIIPSFDVGGVAEESAATSGERSLEV